MSGNNNILTELEEVAPTLVAVSRRNVYSLPAGYFELFPHTVFDLFSRSEQKMPQAPYLVPLDFFANLPDIILEKAKLQDITTAGFTDELEEMPVLKSISKTNIYTLPDGYFEQLQVTRLNEKGKHVLFNTKRIIRIAAAAVIAGLMAVTGNMLLNNNDTLPPVAVGGKVSDFNPTDFNSLSEKEISDFLTTHTLSPDDLSWNSAITDNDLKGNVEAIPDSDLEQYLNENQEPGDITSTGG